MSFEIRWARTPEDSLRIAQEKYDYKCAMSMRHIDLCEKCRAGFPRWTELGRLLKDMTANPEYGLVTWQLAYKSLTDERIEIMCENWDWYRKALDEVRPQVKERFDPNLDAQAKVRKSLQSMGLEATGQVNPFGWETWDKRKKGGERR
jgi:hypothetical protein